MRPPRLTSAVILLAWLLLRLRQRSEAAPDYYWMACGFTGMGLLDGMHALTLPGEAFVWFHAQSRPWWAALDSP